jgi:hypothetical protein
VAPVTPVRHRISAVGMLRRECADGQPPQRLAQERAIRMGALRPRILQDLGQTSLRVEAAEQRPRSEPVGTIIPPSHRNHDRYRVMYGLPLRCKANPEVMEEPFASMYPAYWWSPRLLALMEYARTGPHNAGGHERPVTRSG